MNAELKDKIEQILEEQVRPSLLAHGGNLTLLDYSEGVAHIRFTGACSGCPSADLTLEMLVKEKLTTALPEVNDVVMEQSISDELMNMARTILHKKNLS